MKVVERDEYDKQMQALEDAGKSGFLDTGYDRKELVHGENDVEDRDVNHNDWMLKGGKDD